MRKERDQTRNREHVAAEHLAKADRLRERGEHALALTFYEKSLAHDYGSPRARAMAVELRSRLSRAPARPGSTISIPRDGLGGAAARYGLLREIGRGGTGAVYLAKDVRLGRLAALKVLHHGRRHRRGRLPRLLDEARIAAAISHPGVARIFDLDSERGILVMEYMEGGSLREQLRRRAPLGPERARSLAAGLAAILETIHEAGIVHGDLKPANVLFREAEESGLANPVLVDFGMARSVRHAPSHGAGPAGPAALEGAANPVAAGTPAFMAPEQMRGEPATPRSDLYSLGLILFEVATGKPPFAPEKLLAPAAARLARLPESLPFPLRSLLRDLLAPCPTGRPESASVVRSRLATR